MDHPVHPLDPPLRTESVFGQCRRGEQTDAMGRLKLGPMGASGTGEDYA